MKIIGLTGPSGAGKSYVASVFSANGAACINADTAARKAVVKGSGCLELLRKSFGDDILMPDGNLHRAALAKKAFSSKKNTELLNRITHPFIVDIILKELTYHRNNGADIAVIDAPQLFEADLGVVCDITIGVLADKDIRINRIIKRDGIDQNAAKLRIAASFSDDYFKENCDIIIYNNGNVEELEAAAEKVIQRIESNIEN
ncbi:MAG: dephospho-CoA kinase [Clostridia bacterium]|nr:dephospho-CoA kinase [Clostridia bacterium]MEE1023695.1 dephospho-CoA kinase [Acutalibacteraceae bacterium]